MSQNSKNKDNVWDFQAFKNNATAWQTAVNELFPSNNNYENWQKHLHDHQNTASKSINLYGNFTSQLLDSTNDFFQSTLKNATSCTAYLSQLGAKQAYQHNENVKNNFADYQQALSSWNADRMADCYQQNSLNTQNNLSELFSQCIEAYITMQNNCWGQVTDYLVLRERCVNSAYKTAKENTGK